ncbi:MAG: excinuclease ABC subunit B, partial [Pseudomonadota bacterium]
LPLPARAWEFSPSPVCRVSDASSPTVVEMTFDGQLYTLTLTHPDGWPAADVFSIQFAPRGPFISTSRHQISGATLSVSDVGFGNVLTGLEINEAAIAILGPLQRVVDLSGAAPAIRAFRECDPAPPLS